MALIPAMTIFALLTESSVLSTKLTLSPSVIPVNGSASNFLIRALVLALDVTVMMAESDRDVLFGHIILTWIVLSPPVRLVTGIVKLPSALLSAVIEEGTPLTTTWTFVLARLALDPMMVVVVPVTFCLSTGLSIRVFQTWLLFLPSPTITVAEPLI